MNGIRKGWGKVLGCALIAMTAVGPRISAARADAGSPAHLAWAESLVATIAPANNTYGSPTSVLWKGVDGATSSNNSVCATFLTTLLKRAYNLTNANLKSWTGSTSPSAELYHELVRTENGFTRIDAVDDLQLGDIIAIDYRDGSSSTGHVAVASSLPVDQGIVMVNDVPMQRYDVSVIDSSKSYHGTSDTRWLKKDGTKADEGVGEGLMRIYADPVTGAVPGHSWSDSSGSVIHVQPALDPATGGRHLLIGRY
jgi:hypothetical protein